MEIDEKSIGFYITSGDYFGTLATVLSLLNQNAFGANSNEEGVITLNQIVKDLMYLQANFKIVKK